MSTPDFFKLSSEELDVSEQTLLHRLFSDVKFFAREFKEERHWSSSTVGEGTTR